LTLLHIELSAVLDRAQQAKLQECRNTVVHTLCRSESDRRSSAVRTRRAEIIGG
jgi:hypothetical protein